MCDTVHNMETVFRLSIINYSEIHVSYIATEMETINEPRHEKTNVLVSDQVRHKPGCTATEDG